MLGKMDDLLVLRRVGLKLASNAMALACSSALNYALVWILSSMSLPKKALKQPVECTYFSKGITADGLFRRNERDPALRHSLCCRVCCSFLYWGQSRRKCLTVSTEMP